MLTLYNSLTRSKKIFKPIHPKVVNMYSCGPTVYDHVHIGNLRSFITADILQRVLTHIEGYKLNWVMNITDIDDKMIARIQRDNSNAEPMLALGQLADKFTDIFIDDIELVGISRGDIAKLPRATDHIEGMQDLIKKLLREKIAYISEGSIYFSLEEYKKTGKKYGQLVDLDYQAQGRVLDDQDQKAGAGDFALWKAQKPGEPAWDFDWLKQNYPGRPGWHIECSVMSTSYLGQPFDIHTGGVDLKFPHHENEIAQCGGHQANYFVHNEFLQIEGEKMSKSVGNITTLEQMKDPLAYRLLVLQSHYRSHMEFSEVAFAAAVERLNSLRAYTDQMVLAWPAQLPEKDQTPSTAKFVAEFIEAISDDLNTPNALAAFSGIEGKTYSTETLQALARVDDVLGLGIVDTTPLSSEIKSLVTDYDSARTNKQYVVSDDIRANLRDNFAINISDTNYGPLISRIRS